MVAHVQFHGQLQVSKGLFKGIQFLKPKHNMALIVCDVIALTQLVSI